MTPLVSIITPAWKAAGFLPQTYESIRVQTFEDWEWVIVDDCSPDDSFEVVSSIAAGDSRVRVFRAPQNGGPGPTRNRALEEASGRYVALLDADDLWTATKLEEQVAYLSRGEHPIVCSGFRRMNDAGTLMSRPLFPPVEITHEMMLRRGNLVAALTAMVDTARTGPFRFSTEHYEDFRLWLRLTAAGASDSWVAAGPRTVSGRRTRDAFRAEGGLQGPRLWAAMLGYAVHATRRRMVVPDRALSL